MVDNESVSHSFMSDSLGNPWTVARQAPLCMEFSRQEYWKVCINKKIRVGLLKERLV